jgi:hypothetical protein
MCASPPSPRHAQPDWMGGGLVSRQMTHDPASEAISVHGWRRRLRPAMVRKKQPSILTTRQPCDAPTHPDWLCHALRTTEPGCASVAVPVPAGASLSLSGPLGRCGRWRGGRAPGAGRAVPSPDPHHRPEPRTHRDGGHGPASGPGRGGTPARAGPGHWHAGAGPAEPACAQWARRGHAVPGPAAGPARAGPELDPAPRGSPVKGEGRWKSRVDGPLW